MHILNHRFAPVARRTLTLAAFAITASASFAGPNPPYNVGDAMKAATPPSNELKKQPTPPEAPVIVQEREDPIELSNGRKIFIKAFTFEGVDAKDVGKLSALLASSANRELSMKEINQAASKVSLYYRAKGYIVAKAYIPKQDASQGTLVIRLVKGRYGKLTVKNTSPVRDSMIQGIIEKAKGDASIVTQGGLERAVLLVGDLPGCRVPTITIAPGTAPGTSDFEAKVEPSQRVGGYAMVDNQGSELTGKDRFYGGLDINSPLGFGDKLSFSGMTTNYRDLTSYRAAYSLPLAHNGLRGEVAASRTRYAMGGEYSGLGGEGLAEVIEATISYPVKKSRNDTLNLSLNIASKRLKDDLTAVDTRNPRNAFTSTLGIQRDVFGNNNGRNYSGSASASVTYGTIKIQDDETRILNEAGADSGGTFSKFNLSLSGNLELTEAFSAKGSFKMQHVITSGNLDSSEQFFVSGMNAVRVFTESYGFDDGWLGNAELRYALPSLSGVNHMVGAFFDVGRAFAQKGAYTINNNYVLSDAGLGYYLDRKPFFCALQVANPLWRSDSVKRPGTKFLVQAGVSF